jgi:hypothetical protein
MNGILQDYSCQQKLHLRSAEFLRQVSLSNKPKRVFTITLSFQASRRSQEVFSAGNGNGVTERQIESRERQRHRIRQSGVNTIKPFLSLTFESKKASVFLGKIL